MDKEIKLFIETNFEFLVKLYNRYIRLTLKDASTLEYYASPYMNLIGYPSDKFIIFSMRYYNRKYNKKINVDIEKNEIISKIYLYIKLVFLFFFSFLFFSKKIKKNSIIIHGFHSDDNFKFSPYTTIKSPPLEYFENKNIYHDINLSFVSLKSLHKYKKNNIIFSLRYLTFIEFIKSHYTAFMILAQSRKINLFSISYVNILYTLIKGISIANLINNTKDKTIYLNMWENKGHHLITDYLVLDKKKLIFLDLGIIFRLSPEYTMFHYRRHDIKGKFFFMSEYNYRLVKNILGTIDYDFFKNYRVDCKNYNIKGKKNSILLISPLSLDISKKLYKLILDNNDKKLNIKIRLHPYLNQDDFDKQYIEKRNIYESLNDYDTIIYSGTTTAAIELYFQGKKVYRLISESFIDIDVLTDEKLIATIHTLQDIDIKTKFFTDREKEYYLGCNHKSLNKILEGLNK